MVVALKASTATAPCEAGRAFAFGLPPGICEFHLSSRNSLPLSKEVFLKLHDDMHAGTPACTLVQSMIGLKDLMIVWVPAGVATCHVVVRGLQTIP